MKHLKLFAIAFAVSAAPPLFGCQSSQDLGGPGGAVTTADAGDAAAAEGLRAFVTSATFKGDLVTPAGGGLSGLAAADKLCQTAAGGAGLEGTFVAFISSGSDGAATRLVDGGPYFAVDRKTKLYENKAGVAARAERPIPDERGHEAFDTYAGKDKFGDITAGTSIASFWTGSSGAGQPTGDDCRGWTTSDLFVDGSFATYLGASTIKLSCDQERHVLCLEQSAPMKTRPTKRVFVTSKSFSGDLGGGTKNGLVRGDGLCAKAASAAGLDGTFVAWLSGKDQGGKTVRAPERLTDARHVLLDDTVVFESLADIEAGPKNPIVITELGEPLQLVDSAHVWTGTLANGNAQPDGTCADWTSPTRDYNGAYGVPRTGASWTKAGLESCSAIGHLYCFEQ